MSTTISASAIDLDVEVPDPDDPRSIPIYGGPAWKAGSVLLPGEYRAFWHISRARQGWCTLTVHGDGHSTITTTDRSL